jgi:hypothetical protein
VVDQGVVLVGPGSSLDGLSVRPAPITAPIHTAIRVRGAARRAVISNVTVYPPMRPGEESIGIDVEPGAELTVIASRVEAGPAAMTNVGIRATGARLTVRDCCTSIGADGRCDDAAPCNTPGPAIIVTGQPGAGIVHGIRLDGAALSRIDNSTVCTDEGADGAAIQIAGAAEDTVVTASWMHADDASRLATALQIAECEGGAPWIVDNRWAGASPAAGGDGQGVSAFGDCHPRIERNANIYGCGGGDPNPACQGIACAGGSLCQVNGNARISGGGSDSLSALTAAIECRDGCARISGNTIHAVFAPIQRGINLDRSGPWVDRNRISLTGGGGTESTGIRTHGSWSRIENNVVEFFPLMAGEPMYGLIAEVTPDGRELDVHSNTFGLDYISCTVAPIVWMATGLPTPVSSGILRNNVSFSGDCTPPAVPFQEIGAGADPRIFENNDLAVAAPGAPIYHDEGATLLTSAAQVDALTDVIASGNLSVHPGFSSATDFHLAPTSPLIDRGTATGAPRVDFDGEPRDDGAPDIGADER